MQYAVVCSMYAVVCKKILSCGWFYSSPWSFHTPQLFWYCDTNSHRCSCGHALTILTEIFCGIHQLLPACQIKTIMSITDRT
jgi:hypothetical protein